MADAGTLRLTELDPWWLIPTETGMRRVERPEARGIMFLCPRCFRANQDPIGTHRVVCWDLSVPQTVMPNPGRWALEGSSFEDLSLVAGSSSVLLLGGCNWHGFVTNGDVTGA